VLPRPHVLFYDGSCGLCRRTVRAIQRVGPMEPLEYIDVNDDAAMARFPQVDRLTALKRVVLLRDDGTQRTAYNAVTDVLRLLPRFRRIYFLLRFWPVQIAGHAVYHIVGHNRHRISRLLHLDDVSSGRPGTG
jgi:predicted DCC family thiol-disulfide oxidoreductase YuxK